MKTKIVTIFTIIAVGVVCSVSTSYYTKRSMDKSYANSLANSNLYELTYIVDALEELKKSESAEPVVQDKLETILVTSLAEIRAINPNIENLEGTPTSTLCRIIKYSHEYAIAENGIGKYQDKNLPQLATSYLEAVEPTLREITQKTTLPIQECNEVFGVEKEYKVFK